MVVSQVRRCRRSRIGVLVLGIIVLLVWRSKSAKRGRAAGFLIAGGHGRGERRRAGVCAPRRIYAHNLMLRNGPNVRIHVRCLRGAVARTRAGVVLRSTIPNFFLQREDRRDPANIGDAGNFLMNAGGISRWPLKNLKLSAAEIRSSSMEPCTKSCRCRSKRKERSRRLAVAACEYTFLGPGRNCSDPVRLL